MSSVSYQAVAAVDVATRDRARAHQVLDAIIHRAVLRDLDRLTGALAAPVTAVRRAALIGHATFLATELYRHHRVEDEVLWTRAVVRDPEVAARAEQLRHEHRDSDRLAAAMTTAAQAWAVGGGASGRLNLRTAAAEVSTSLAPRLAREEATAMPLACAVLTADDWAAVARATPRPRRPTALAREVFWLLDELDGGRAAMLLARMNPLRVWVLRNGFSGAYNRGSYLMWVGGGLGPRV
jgi:hypothetical protein